MAPLDSYGPWCGASAALPLVEPYGARKDYTVALYIDYF